MKVKPIIYQLFPRWFTNTNENCIPSGTIAQNGVGKMNQITSTVLNGIKELGVTHIWFTGIIEHATKTDYSAFGIKPDNKHVVKGEAGSPYAIKDYYDVCPDVAENVADRMSEFQALVARVHESGMKVIIDFVPNHTARQYNSDAKPAGVEDFGATDDKNLFFGHNNNYYYIPNQIFAPSIDLGSGEDTYVEYPAKATGDDCFSAFAGVNNWYETAKLNYGVDYGDFTRHFDPVPDTWSKMLHILRYWASKGVDGFRCDMVHMVPLEFWKWVIPQVKEVNAELIFIAELYDVGLYRPFIFEGGFDYLYDKVNLYDTLRGIQCHNYPAAALTGCWQRVDGIGDHLLNFLENHDEQRFGSKQFAGDPYKVIPALVVSATISTGPMMIYAGQELGEQATDAEGFSGLDGRTTIFDYWSVPTVRRWYDNGKCTGRKLTSREKQLRKKYARLLSVCNDCEALRQGRFFDLMYVNFDNPTLNPHRQYVYLRSTPGQTVLVAVNFADTECTLGINIPQHAFDLLQLPQGQVKATDLLTGEEAKMQLSPSEPFVTDVKPCDARIWLINHGNPTKPKKRVATKPKSRK